MTKNGNGTKGENFAVDYLKENGYKILDRNYFRKCGEIDIVATRGDVIAFVEVKTRAQNYIVSPAESVTYTKRKKIINTAILYMQKYQYDLQPRFDVIEVVTESTKDFTVIRHNHIISAFDASGR